MKLATLTTKTVLITTTSVAGAAAAFVLIAPTLGWWPFAETDVADAEVTQEVADSPSPSATATAPTGSTSPRKASKDEPATQGAPVPIESGAGSSNAPPVASGGSRSTTKPPAQDGAGTKPGGGSPDGRPEGFEIKGSVTGTLYPTVTNDLVVKIENPYSFAIEIVSAAVSVGNAGTCSGRHLWINGNEPDGAGIVTLPTGQRVAGNGESTYTVTAQLQNSAGDNCQNASFPLTYTGKAVKR